MEKQGFEIIERYFVVKFYYKENKKERKSF